MLIKDNRYCIKKDYKINSNVDYASFEVGQETPYRIYEFVQYLIKTTEIKSIIHLGPLSIEQKNKLEEHVEVEVIQGFSKEAVSQIEKLPSEKVRKSIVIVSNLLEAIPNIQRVLKKLSTISYECPFLLLTVSERNRLNGIKDYGPPKASWKVREWSIDEWNSLLNKYKFNNTMLGYIPNGKRFSSKNNILTISGDLVYRKPHRQLDVLAIINLYNEKDIIEEVIENLIKEQVDVLIIDNWSDDGSYEVVTTLQERYKDKLQCIRFPNQPERYYEWGKLLDNVVEVAKDKNYDWIIHHDSDEIRISPWKDVNLRDSISFIDSKGYNAIDFTVLDFRPTKQSCYTEKTQVEDELKYFEFGKRPGHFLQVKGWKNEGNLEKDLSSSGGHVIQFDGKKVYPLKFIMKHYPLRSQLQAQKKIFKDRKERISPIEREEKGWHTHYDKFSEDHCFVWDESTLNLWDDHIFYEEFILERISGLNIVE